MSKSSSEDTPWLSHPPGRQPWTSKNTQTKRSLLASKRFYVGRPNTCELTWVCGFGGADGPGGVLAVRGLVAAALQAGVVLPQEPLLVVEHQRRVLAPVRDRVLLPYDAVQLQKGWTNGRWVKSTRTGKSMVPRFGESW